MGQVEGEGVGASPTDVAMAAERLRAGRLVAFPTETVYGLGADARNEAAVARVFAAKGRPSRNPLIVHVTGPAMAREVAGRWPREAEVLARALWPGPVTLVVPRGGGGGGAGEVSGGGISAAVTAGSAGVALRAPAHPLALALLYTFNGPLVGPSANRSGGVSPTTAGHVREAFSGEDVLTLDGGACQMGIESTVVWLVERPLRVLRPGVVGAAEIAAILGEPVLDADEAGAAEDGRAGGPLHSPGRLASHYAPRAKAILIDPDEIEDFLEEAGAAVVAHAVPMELEERLEAGAVAGTRLIRLPMLARGYAAGLYAALRAADALGPTLIAIQRPPEPEADDPDAAVWRAIADRLMRATA